MLFSLIICAIEVAVCGLPNPDENHFITMSRFAADASSKFKVLVKELEVKLGPDTGDLNVRIGLHSGPVTAVRNHLQYVN
jgi:class 3 adenylate cyclase